MMDVLGSRCSRYQIEIADIGVNSNTATCVLVWIVAQLEVLCCLCLQLANGYHRRRYPALPASVCRISSSAPHPTEDKQQQQQSTTQCSRYSLATVA